MRLVALIVVFAAAAPFTAASADEEAGLPYRLWWSFPRDDVSAVEIDDPDLHVSDFTSRWQFVSAMQRCEFKRGDKLLKRREGTPLREVRIESLDPEGAVRTTSRCVMTLAAWRARLGQRLTDRLDDELDAHVSFLLPRHQPKAPEPAR